MAAIGGALYAESKAGKSQQHVALARAAFVVLLCLLPLVFHLATGEVSCSQFFWGVFPSCFLAGKPRFLSASLVIELKVRFPRL